MGQIENETGVIKSGRQSKVDEDPIEAVIGSFGIYQCWVLFLAIFGCLPTGYQVNNVVFLIPSVEYTCLDVGANNATNFCPCENPMYDTRAIKESVTTEWNLICDRTWLASLTQSMMQVGVLVGSLFYGHLSDKYGRKKASLISMSIQVIVNGISGVVPDLWMFLACRFFTGTCMGGTLLSFYVLLIELHGKSFRPYLIGLNELSFFTAYFTLPIIAYFVRDWRNLQLVTSVPWILTLSYFWLLPESPRWLITKGRIDEAVKLLKQIAKRNKKSVANVEVIVRRVYEDTIKSKEQNGSYMDLFKIPKIRRYTVITALMWMIVAHTFYGISQYIGRLEGDLYVNVLISASFHAPGIVLITLAIKKFKRRVTVVSTFSIAGAALLVFLFVPLDYKGVYLALAIVGLLGTYTSFVQVLLYTSEIFPTVVRNSAMSFGSMFARFGAFTAPFVVNIRVKWVSILIFSGFSFCAAFLCCFLPETKGIVLQDTIDVVHVDKAETKGLRENENDES